MKMCRMFLRVYKNVVAYLFVSLFFVVLLPLIVITLPLIVITLPLIRSIKLSKMDIQVNNDRTTYSLALTTDIIHLSRRQCFVRSHMIELFVATEADALIGHSSGPRRIIAGQVGVRCVYCFNRDKKKPYSTYFPKKIHNLYVTCLEKMQSHHFRLCTDIPPTVRAAYEDSCKSFHRGQTSVGEYWIFSAESIGLIDTTNGIAVGNNDESRDKFHSQRKRSIVMNDYDDDDVEWEMNDDVEEVIQDDAVVLDNGVSIFEKIGSDMTNNIIEYIDEWTMLTTIRLLSNDWNRFVMQQRPTKIRGVCSLISGLRGSFFDLLERRRRAFFADATELTLSRRCFGDITLDEVKARLPGLEMIRHRTWIPVDGTIISVNAGTLSYAAVEVYKHSKRCSSNRVVVLWKDYGSVAVVDRELIHPFVDPPLPRLRQNRRATNFLRYYM